MIFESGLKRSLGITSKRDVERQGIPSLIWYGKRTFPTTERRIYHVLTAIVNKKYLAFCCMEPLALCVFNGFGMHPKRCTTRIWQASPAFAPRSELRRLHHSWFSNEA